MVATTFVRPVSNESWSPYYRIGMKEANHRRTITVNGSLHQVMLDFDYGWNDEFVRLTDEYFQIPYSYLPQPEDVLILGAGSGNDVVIARKMGAKRIDAVEIDPVIQSLGADLHYNRPYEPDGRVRVFVDDARAFLRKTDKRYDLIVLGTLDSHTLLSGYSSIRLDNFLYTRESFEEIRDHLKPGGVVAVFHLSARPYISGKIALIMAEAFDRKPTILEFERGTLFNYLFLSGDSVPEATALPPHMDVSESNVIATDDWPFLYLEKPSLPGHYLAVLAAILLVAVFGIRGFGRRSRGRFDPELFFLGGGFLLIETKSVTEMSLLFGSTWVVNLVVFSSILIVILCGNLWVALRKSDELVKPFLLLGLAIAVALAVPYESLLSFPLAVRGIGAGFIIGAPILFASVIFARLFKSHSNPTSGLAWNLCGAIVGGMLEYAVMLVGIRSLYFFGLLLYGAAAVSIWRKTKRKSAKVEESVAVPEVVRQF